jgi:hypothetical protein
MVRNRIYTVKMWSVTEVAKMQYLQSPLCGVQPNEIPLPVASGDDFCSDLSISLMLDRYLDPVNRHTDSVTKVSSEPRN